MEGEIGVLWLQTKKVKKNSQPPEADSGKKAFPTKSSRGNASCC
jgi:hypothetical protein